MPTQVHGPSTSIHGAWLLGLSLAVWAAVTLTAASVMRDLHPPARFEPAPARALAAREQLGLDLREELVAADALRPDVVAAQEAPSAPVVEAPGSAAPIAAADPGPARPGPAASPAAKRGHRAASRRAPGAVQARTPTGARAAQVHLVADPSTSCGGGRTFTQTVCVVFRCATGDYRHHPTCRRLHAEGDARRALEQSHGGA